MIKITIITHKFTFAVQLVGEMERVMSNLERKK
jgi:hypothetical protein